MTHTTYNTHNNRLQYYCPKIRNAWGGGLCSFTLLTSTTIGTMYDTGTNLYTVWSVVESEFADFRFGNSICNLICIYIQHPNSRPRVENKLCICCAVDLHVARKH